MVIELGREREKLPNIKWIEINVKCYSPNGQDED